MIKGRVLIVLFYVISVITLMSLSNAFVNVTQDNIKDKYYLGEKVSGTMILSLENEGVDSIISSNFGESNNLLDIIKKRATCIPFDCSYKYSATNPYVFKNINLNTGEEKITGFMVFGDKVRITDISFNLSSNFPESDEIPLKLNFFGRSNWIYDTYSTDYSKSESWGCYETEIPIGGIGVIPYEKYALSYNSKYCEKIFIPESAKVRAGARIEGSSQNELRMSVYSSDSSHQLLASQKFSPQTGYADIERDFKWYQAGNYYFCLGLENTNNQVTDLSIFRENYGTNCGWYIPQGYNLDQMLAYSSGIDYSIYAKTGRYAVARPTEVYASTDLINSANYYLNQSYGDRCTNGCIFPIIFSGINQALNVNNLKVDYEIISSSGGITNTNKFYDISKEPAKMSFFGTIDAKELNFSIKSKSSVLTLKFNDNKILEKDISIFSGSSINDLYPKNPPAGMKAKLNALIQSDVNITKYEWYFGDNETAETRTNFVEHVYKSIGSYTLTLRITDANGLVMAKDFTITTTSPIQFIKEDLTKKSQRLDNLTRSMAGFPIWYQDAIKSKINFSYYQDSIRDLELSTALTIAESELVNIYMRLQSLDVPFYVFVSEKSSSPLIESEDSIDLELIKSYSGERINNYSEGDYRASILKWKDDNLISKINKTKISYFDSNENIKSVLTIYNLDIENNLSVPSYLVLDRDLDEIYFHEESIEPIRFGESTIIELKDKNQFEFYDLSGEELNMFVFPELSKLTIIKGVEKCNGNKICEKGENWVNCRSDCKPFSLFFIYIIILAILLLCLYTFLAWWYKSRYEISLFGDKKRSYNIVMFILNSRVNGLNDWKIKDLLSGQGWDSEQISYGFKRADGKRIGFPEIIPLDKLKLILMKKKVKKNSITTQNQRIIKW